MLETAWDFELWMVGLLMARAIKGSFESSGGSSVLSLGILSLTFLCSTTCGSAIEWGSQRTEQCSHGFCVTPDYR